MLEKVIEVVKKRADELTNEDIEFLQENYEVVTKLLDEARKRIMNG